MPYREQMGISTGRDRLETGDGMPVMTRENKTSGLIKHIRELGRDDYTNYSRVKQIVEESDCKDIYIFCSEVPSMIEGKFHPEADDETIREKYRVRCKGMCVINKLIREELKSRSQSNQPDICERCGDWNDLFIKCGEIFPSQHGGEQHGFDR